MNTNTAVRGTAGARIGAIVRSGTSVWVYWSCAGDGNGLAVRVCDLSGRTAPDLLEGSGVRIVQPEPGHSSLYLEHLLPGRPYAVEVGTMTANAFETVLGPVTVETPWQRSAVTSAFPAPYHRS